MKEWHQQSMKLNRQKEHSSETCFSLISAACHNYHKAIKNISEPLPEPLIASCGLFRCKNPVTWGLFTSYYCDCVSRSKKPEEGLYQRKQDSYSLFIETFTEAVISWPQVQKCERLCLHSHAILSELSLWHYYSKHFCSGSLVQCNLADWNHPKLTS